MENEIWKEIKGHEGYYVSNFGRIKSLRNKNLKIIKGYVQNTGYPTVTMDYKKYSIHRLVAESFLKKIKGKNIVNHIDGNKENNNVNNLEWCTYKENSQHAYKTGLMDNAINKTAKLKPRAKNVLQYNLNGDFVKKFKGSMEAQKFLNSNGIKVNARNIRSVCERKRKSAGGYLWKYE